MKRKFIFRSIVFAFFINCAFTQTQVWLGIYAGEGGGAEKFLIP